MRDAINDIVVTAITTDHPDDEVTIVAGGASISGWEEVEVTLRAEGFPNNFTIGASASADVLAAAFAGQSCTVLLGDDLVITGFIDRDIAGGSATGHAVQLIGRGKTQDLVDCSAEWPSGQQINGDALSIAQNIAGKYNLAVELADGAPAGEQVPKWLLNYGDTGADIIQRVARNAGLLAYEDAHGVLQLAVVGTEKAASGVVYGGNVQAWNCENAMDQRYSDIVCCRMGMDAMMELPGGTFYHTEPDPNVPRHRLLYIGVESTAADPPGFTIKRAIWEVARRAGRSQVVRATVDSWRDSAGKLWTPNTLVPVSVPGNRAGDALILSEVTFRRNNESGTTADLVLMPAKAFAIEPIVLDPLQATDIPGGGTPAPESGA